MLAMGQPSVADAEVVVEDNPEESRYEARVADRIIGIAEYELPDVEGLGVGSRLARGALDDVRRRGLRAVVECPFISAYVKRHHDYDDLIER